MKIETIKLNDLKPYDKNSKTHPKKQIDLLAKNIEKFGFTTPILIDENNNIIAGHGRLDALKQLKIEEAPCVRMENLTEQEIKALRLADNKIAEMGEWDMDLAIQELKELDDDLLGLTGFDADLLIEPDENDDVIPEDVPPVAKLGDLWALGRHRLLCGDAPNSEDVSRLMEGKKADMVFTDPPYNINYKGQGKNTSNTILQDNITDDAFDIFLDKVFANFREHTKAGGGNYVFHDSKTQIQFQESLEKNGFEIKNQLIWNKPVGMIGMYAWNSHYSKKHEPFFYAGNKDTETVFYNQKGISKTVWDFQKTDIELLNWAKKQKKAENNGKTTIWTVKKENVQEYKHPTQKPVELISYAIHNSSKADDIVLDLFGGSGSTLIACEKTNRICYMSELDPKYCDVIIKRWEDFTGLKAEKI
jgi:site-specific DNA-methyltransferase (adenine-specific)